MAKFFDKVQHDIVIPRVARKVRAKRLLALIGKYRRAQGDFLSSIFPNGLKKLRVDLDNRSGLR